MKYRVIKDFTDLKDDNHVYLVGDSFPRKGAKVDNARYLELSTDANKRGEALIEAVEVPQEAEIQPQKDEKGEAEEVVKKAEKKPRKAKKKEK